MQASSSIILGIDPGSNLMGYALLQIQGKKPHVLTMGIIDLRKLATTSEKLRKIHKALYRIVQEYQPTHAAIEAPFYGKDAQAMLKLGRAQGAAMAAVSLHDIEVVEYSPRSIKKAVTGKGNSTKEQVAAMLPHIVTGDLQYKFLDATDAVSVAYCHYLQQKQGARAGKTYSSWDSFLKANPNRKR